ncbi:MAG: beta-ketoacyl-ACP synthase III [Methylacidiphilales bacterium]|nr:beta-ketoacyl-ACP synthase III [Candidatus Methylacidiphilales bacterium]
MIRLIGTGSCMGDTLLSNSELSKLVDTTDDWIKSRTGIEQRFITKTTSADDAVVNYAVEASKNALENAKISASDIDLVIVATCTPGRNLPSVACRVQNKLGISKKCQAFDVSAACSGFTLALHTARGLFLSCPEISKALIIGSEVISSIVDWNDRSTCVLFGDGAGAVILERSSSDVLFDTYFKSDGSFINDLYSDPNTNFIKMDGKKVFTYAVVEMVNTIQYLLDRNKLDQSKISLLIPHQANLRIIESIGKKLEISSDKIIKTIDRHANTSAASIPIALDYANRNNFIKALDLVVLASFGGGFAWGGALFTWPIKV